MRENAMSTREREAGGERFTNSVVGPHPPRLARDYEIFVRVSLAGIEPVGFRVKNDLRNHQAIVQPRLYDCFTDCLMVTQITLQPNWDRRCSVAGPLSTIHDAVNLVTQAFSGRP